jgi:predicted nucleotidyltransferase component of viral defense system
LIIKTNQYKVQYFPEIDRLINAQTIETMFANKLVAIMDRYDLHHTIAGRDIYDIHHFFISGYSYLGPVIKERTGVDPKHYFEKLIEFIKQKVTQTTINEDLSTLLPNQKFQAIRKVLIPETISFLTSEQKQPKRMIS